jgi:hypothetical protein
LGLDNFVDLLVEEWSLAITFVLAMVELISNILYGIIGLLPEIVDCDSGSQDAIVGVDNILNKGRGVPYRRRSQLPGCPAQQL